MNTIINAKSNLKFCDDTIEIKEKLESVFLEIGRRLDEIVSKKMWVGKWEDFDNFCKYGLKIDRSVAFKLMAIYRKFVLEFDIDTSKLSSAGGWTRLAMILPLVDTKEKAEEWVHECIHANSRSDLKKIIHERVSGVDPMKCSHPPNSLHRYTVVTCDKCSESWREHDIIKSNSKRK